MVHKMGLASITLGTKNIPNTRYFNADESSYTDNGSYSVTASSTFDTNIPYLSSSTYYSIVKSSTATSFRAAGTDGWKNVYNANIESGKYGTFAAESKRLYRYKGWEYNSTGGMQSLAVSQTGNYKLEVWGAQGGKTDILPATYIGPCKGGYSYGTKDVTSGNTLFRCVGVAGGDGIYGNSNPAQGGSGGYNGGGNGGGSTTAGSAIGGGGGGGATHIATATGTLYSLLNGANSSTVLIVAGGGGGSTDHQAGGSGGGATGGGTQSVYALGIGGNEGSNSIPTLAGASSTYYYRKGQGENGCGKTVYNAHGTSGCGGGGGGYYGGHAYQDGNGSFTDVAGAGGSGYVGGVSGGSTSNGVRSGNGYARITTNFEWAF